MQAGDVEAAAAALAGVANKGITAQTVADVNALMGITATPDQAAAVAQQARDVQTRGAVAPAATAAPTVEPAAASLAAPAALRGRANAAHASAQALSHAAPNSAVGQMAAYQAAVQAKDYDTAAAVLAATSNKAVTAETVRGVNGLLGLTVDDATVTDLAAQAQALQQAPRR